MRPKTFRRQHDLSFGKLCSGNRVPCLVKMIAWRSVFFACPISDDNFSYLKENFLLRSRPVCFDRNACTKSSDEFENVLFGCLSVARLTISTLATGFFVTKVIILIHRDTFKTICKQHINTGIAIALFVGRNLEF